MSHEKDQIPIQRIETFVELLEVAATEMRIALEALKKANIKEYPHGAWKTLHTGMEHLYDQGRKFVGPLSPLILRNVDDMLLPEQLEEKKALADSYRAKRAARTKKAIAQQLSEAAKKAGESPRRKSKPKSQ